MVPVCPLTQQPTTSQIRTTAHFAVQKSPKIFFFLLTFSNANLSAINHPNHKTRSRKITKRATMALLRDAPCCHLCPPGAHSGSCPPLYRSRVMPTVLGFAKVEGERPTIFSSEANFASLMTSAFFVSHPPPLTLLNKMSAQACFSP